MILRLLNPQGVAGLAAALCLAFLLILQKGETRHWRKQSAQFEQLHRHSEAALASTIASYRAAAAQARASDEANARRVAAEQRAINERTSDEFEARLAAARARASRMRTEPAGPDNSGARGSASVPSLSIASGRADEGSGQDRFPRSDRLIATEQAIQLDELIKWVRRQQAVDPNVEPGSP